MCVIESSICPNERFLGGIFRIGGIARIPHCKLYYPGPVLEHQLVEGSAFTGLRTPHKAEITNTSARREIGTSRI
jgi:hypothetical protein